MNGRQDSFFQHYDDDEEVDVKYFVGGLPVRCQPDEIQYAFQQWGKVSDAIVIKDPATQRTRGFGFVTIRAKRDVHTLVQIQSHKVAGKAVSVKEAKVEGNVSQKLFLKNVALEHTEQELIKYFGQFGAVDQVHIAKENGLEDGMNAYITFVNAQGVKEALNANSESCKQVVCGKELEVRKYMTSRGGSQLDRSGRGARVVPNSSTSAPVEQPDWWGSNGYASSSYYNYGYGVDGQYSGGCHGSGNFESNGWYPGVGPAVPCMPGYTYPPSVLPGVKKEKDKKRSVDSSSSDSSSSTSDEPGQSDFHVPGSHGSPSLQNQIQQWQAFIRASGGLAPDASHLESWLRASGAIAPGEPQATGLQEQSSTGNRPSGVSRSRSAGSSRNKRRRPAGSRSRRHRRGMKRKSSRRREKKRSSFARDSPNRSSRSRRRRQASNRCSRDRSGLASPGCLASPASRPQFGMGDSQENGTCHEGTSETGVVRRLTQRELSPPLFSRSRSPARKRRQSSVDGVSM